VARNFNKMDPTTKTFVSSGMSAKTGLDMPSINAMIQATLPKFKAPNGMVSAG